MALGTMRVRLALALGGLAMLGAAAAPASAQLPTTDDPRAALSPGLDNAGTAAKGMQLLANRPKAWSDPANPGSFAFAGSDAAFQGNYAFVGNFNGFQIFDVSNPAAPVMKAAVTCPGGQGDLSVYGNLLFMSVEETRAKKDCTLDPPATAETRFRGVRIFDISNIEAPVQVHQVQTCRGSHTHTLVEGKDDPGSVYIYVSGTAGPRPSTEMPGCFASNEAGDAASSGTSSRWRIEVIKVPLAAPTQAAIVNTPRLFADESGRHDGLQNTPPAPTHPSGGPWSPSPVTDACHDITVYEALDLAAGACEGNGILLDISDPANPKRTDAVADPMFAYWHGATFSNDGKTIVFTDEWGGGTGARCRATDQLSWGANAIYDVVDGKMVFRSYYKLPVAQTSSENCVAHVGSLVPVPGRDILVQAWYQGGTSLVDFTDSANPKEIGYFDRGPISPTALMLGGHWSSYWYNGNVYGTEIARGLDTFALTPAAGGLTEADIKAASQADKVVRHNPQTQQPITWTLTSDTPGTVGGTVPATLALTLGSPPASFGAFTPGVTKLYEASSTATVTSTAGDALLSVSDAGPNAGHLVNGAFALPQPLQLRARNAANTGTAYNNVGSSLNLLQYSAPISNDEVSLQFAQQVNANDALRTGTYSKTLTFTLSTTNP
jgi:hypothetical protein